MAGQVKTLGPLKTRREGMRNCEGMTRLAGASLNPIAFIVSAPRSGSTWLMNALSQHPEIFATENRLFGRFCELWPNANGDLRPRITADEFVRAVAGHFNFAGLTLTKAEFIDEFTEAYLEMLGQFSRKRSGKAWIVDKITPYPGTGRIVRRQLRQRFPDAKKIRLIRDGRDVVTSGAFDWLSRIPETSRYQLFVERRPGLVLARFFDDEFLVRWAENWVESIETLPANATTVSFEAMKLDQASELLRLYQHLGIEADPQRAQQCAAATTFQKLTGRQAGDGDFASKSRKGIVGDWQRYFTREDGRLFESLAGTWLRKFGYTQSADWSDELPERLNLTAEDVESAD